MAKIKERIIFLLCIYSFRISANIFWIYFLVIIFLYFFDIEIGKTLAYVFWLLLGFYLGNAVAHRIFSYLRDKK